MRAVSIHISAGMHFLSQGVTYVRKYRELGFADGPALGYNGAGNINHQAVRLQRPLAERRKYQNAILGPARLERVVISPVHVTHRTQVVASLGLFRIGPLEENRIAQPIFHFTQATYTIDDATSGQPGMREQSLHNFSRNPRRHAYRLNIMKMDGGIKPRSPPFSSPAPRSCSAFPTAVRTATSSDQCWWRTCLPALPAESSSLRSGP